MHDSGWHLVGASVAGSYHRREGRPCEDAHAALERGGVLALAVSDGAGSARHARRGAELVAAAFCHGSVSALGAGARPEDAAGWRTCGRQLLWDVRGALVDEVARSEESPGRAVSLHDLAATLVGVVVADGWALVVQVGDGAAVLGTDRGYRCVTRPHKGEYANETIFVTSEGAPMEAQVEAVDATGLTGVVLLSDGLERLALDVATWTPHAPFFDRLLAFARRDDMTDAEKREALVADLDAERIRERSDDDRTLVIAAGAAPACGAEAG